ncbi:hypothetical protein HAX54_012669 [Datura stramonium]|uniref:Uncharacterized protein n=1 Tax=Datura stramonium TaxID=4076 RepID=A0ABS8TK29_DATST|nr:hypothetical protein [Datura stramonium]
MIDFSSQVNQFNDRLLSCSSRIAARAGHKRKRASNESKILELRAYIEPTLPDRTAFVLEYQSSSSLGNERVKTDGDQRWTASQALTNGARAVVSSPTKS